MGLTRERDVEQERRRTPVYLMLFDVLHADGTSLLRAPYTERRERLFELVAESEHIHVPDAFEGSVDAAFESSRKLRLEGVMAKRVDSVYLPGKRTRTWAKLKHASDARCHHRRLADRRRRTLRQLRLTIGRRP